MTVVCLGMSHHSAPVSLRERLALSAEDQHAFYSRFDRLEFRREIGVTELGILSTCNRTELYVAAGPRHGWRQVSRRLGKLLAHDRGVPLEIVERHLYHHGGTDAVRHLCRVAAGLDSMVLGESEILGQVQTAHQLAAREGLAGPLLAEAFQTAIRAGRRARAETGICRTPASVASEAIRVARQIAGNLASARILIVGTGKMSHIAGRTLRAKGARHVTVVSRTRRHAERLARDTGAHSLGWHELGRAIADADVVFCSTGAPTAVITRELVRGAMAHRTRPGSILFVDIAVPRDVEEGVTELPNIRVIDIDALMLRLDANLADRRQEIPRVEAIIEDELFRFEDWRHAAELRPLLSAIRSRSEEIRRHELRRISRRLAGAAPEVRDQVERFSRALVNKLLHEPTRRLRDETDPDRRAIYTAVIEELFGLGAKDGDGRTTP